MTVNKYTDKIKCVNDTIRMYKNGKITTYKIVNKFPQNFFTNLTPYIPTLNEKKHDKPFKWSKNVLNGKAKIKLVSLSK